MNKLMIAAAAATLAVASYGSIVVTNCHTVTKDACPQLIFKVTGSGKTASANVKGYKTVAKVKISKGALVLWGSDEYGDGCCYPKYSLYLNVKVGKNTYKFLKPESELESWTIFGKNFEAADDIISEVATKSKKVSLESQIGLSHMKDEDFYDEDAYNYGDDEAMAFFATAFGKVTVKYAASKSVGKGQCAKCVDANYDVIPGSYSGWFAGVMAQDGDDLCLTCDCTDNDVFGGTWKAKYNKAMSVAGGWKKAAAYTFGSAMANAMDPESESELAGIE